MRISVDEKDPGFTKYAELISDGYRIRILFNGTELKGVVTADDDEGIVIATRYTPEGNPVAVGNTVVYDKLRGEVKIKIDRPGIVYH